MDENNQYDRQVNRFGVHLANHLTCGQIKDDNIKQQFPKASPSNYGKPTNDQSSEHITMHIHRTFNAEHRKIQPISYKYTYMHTYIYIKINKHKDQSRLTNIKINPASNNAAQRKLHPILYIYNIYILLRSFLPTHQILRSGQIGVNIYMYIIYVYIRNKRLYIIRDIIKLAPN